MINKTLLCIGALALSTLSIASAKSYDIILAHPTKVGTAQLTPGEYKVKVDGSNAIFTDAQNGKSVTVPVKIGTSDKKFDATTVDSAAQGDMDQVKTIDLGGSKTILEFGQ